MTRFLLVCAGGAIGSGARYLLTLGMIRLAGAAFPWGTLLVNVIGCFLLAVVVEGWPMINPEMRLLFTAGVMGGFTTYSAFNYDTVAYLRLGAYSTAFANVALTTLLCFGAGLLGIAAGKVIAG